MLEDVTVSLISERRNSQPWGLAGGGPGASGENWVLRGGSEDAAEPLPDKCTLRLSPGDVLRMKTPAAEAGASTREARRLPHGPASGAGSPGSPRSLCRRY